MREKRCKLINNGDYKLIDNICTLEMAIANYILWIYNYIHKNLCELIELTNNKREYYYYKIYL